MMAAHHEFAIKQSNPTFIGLGSVGASLLSQLGTLRIGMSLSISMLANMILANGRPCALHVSISPATDKRRHRH